jgi:hypothetical protein
MRRSCWIRRAVPAAALTALAVWAAPSPAATREPLSEVLHPRPAGSAFGYGAPRARPDARALRTMARASARRFSGAGSEFQISSTHYGPRAIESVAATLRSLDHGPEMSTLSVYVATPAEIRETCGATVLACYAPSESRMVVSGVDRPIAGIPRAFAIAHEYGHHIANSQAGDTLPALDAGTIRWATYERVCQLTRAGRLYPGNQAAHYWQDPEEAFAQSYAELNRPGAGVAWDYSSFLQPTAAALAKLHTDVSRPWRGPVTWAWNAASSPGSRAVRAVRTPLDGTVSIALQSAPGVGLRLLLRDPHGGQVLAHAATDEEGNATLSYSNCGRDSLTLEVRGAAGPGGFRAAVTRP